MKNVIRLRSILYTAIAMIVFAAGCSRNEPKTSAEEKVTLEIKDFKFSSPMQPNLKTVEIALAANETTSFANAPRWLQADKTFVIAYFTLPQGATATANGVALNSGGGLNMSSGTASITVTSGKDKTTYTISIANYNSESNPYGVYTAGELSDVRNAMGITDKYKLMNDISLPNLSTYKNDTEGMGIKDYATAGWEPIGSVGAGFRNTFIGGFDGNGYVISNLNIVRRLSRNVGLFGVIDKGCEIKNLGVNISAGKVIGYTNVGGLVGINYNGKVSNSYTTGGGVEGQNQVGGLVGYVYSEGSVSNSYASVAVEGMNKIGGLVGYNEGSKVLNSYATGVVKGNASGSNYIGGLVGNNSSTGTVKNCYSTGAVTGAKYTGGLIGTHENSTEVNNNYWDINTGTINSAEDNTKGVGNVANATGVTGKTTADMKVATAYDDTWTTTNWTFTAGQYPKLVGVGGQ